MTSSSHPFEIPGYRILRRLGAGGMATVYLAVQESLARPVAIKVLAAERTPNADLVRRFEHEARTIARLDHPHIVGIYDVGRTSTGQIYYTMPYLPNGDLSRRNLRDDPLRVLDVVQALADALGYAHDHGIVHRDVKPENVLFDSLDRPLLADFGIALTASRSTRSGRMTRDGAAVGSSGYMSPEQARGQPLDGRSDFYSLGVVCYELLTGEMPFSGPDSLAVALAHIEKPVPRLPVTRRAWQPLIDKALAKSPEARFQSADELLAALAVLGKRLQTPPRNPLARRWLALLERFVAIPRRVRAFGLIGLIALLFGGLLALLPQVPQPAAQPVPAATAALASAGGAAPASAPPASPAAPEPAQDAGAAPPAAPPAAAEAPEAAAGAAEARAAAREALLREAAALAADGKLTEPVGDSAADRYLAVLRDEPQQREAVRGIGRLLDALAHRAAEAIGRGDAGAAGKPIGQGVVLAEQARLTDGGAFGAFKAEIERAVERRRALRRDAFDTAAIEPLAPLLPALARMDAEAARALQADLDRPAVLIAAGGTFRDAGGPELVIVPTVLAASGGIERAFAVSSGEITRGAYERYVEASARPASPCRESQRLFARSEGLGWRTPGFAQADDHPVVCVSWSDADAYARWLSQRTGARYRLPSAAEWRLLAQAAGSGTACGAANLGRRSRGGDCDDGYAYTAPVGRFAPTAPGVYDIAGNVGEWIDGCFGSEEGGCRERAFRGLSWRDGDDQSNLSAGGRAADDIGYAGVGFRLVRELPPVRGAR